MADVEILVREAIRSRRPGFYLFGWVDEIETMGRRGEVREIQFFHTVTTQPDRSIAVLPNGEILESGLSTVKDREYAPSVGC